MDLRDALKQDYHDAQRERGLSAERINVEYGHTGDSSWAYQMMDGKMPMPLSMIATWRRLTGARHLMQWIASETFHAAAPIPMYDSEDADLWDVAANAVEAVTDAMKTHAAILRDRNVTQEEDKEFSSKADTAIAFTYLWKLHVSAAARRPRYSRAATLADAERVAS